MNLFYDTRYSGFVQDDWQVSPRFTLSYGVRYMLQTTWKERDNAQANFDFSSRSSSFPAPDLPPQSQQKLFDAYPIGARSELLDPDADTNNLAPRFGFA